MRTILSLIYLLTLPLTPLSFRSIPSSPSPSPCKTQSSPNPFLRPDKLTVLINGYSELRIPLLRSIAGSYASSTFVAGVFVLWGNPSTPPETLRHLAGNLSLLYSAGPPVTVVPHGGSDSLNSRFLPRRWITTRGVLVCDDDVEVDPTSVEFSFRVWQSNQDRLIGLFARSHSLDLGTKSWMYTVHPDRYSIILTKFMILNVEYLYTYSCGVRGLEDEFHKLRGVVDDMRNCEDILMNFVVAEVSGRGPVLVGAERVRDWGDPRNEVEGGGRGKEVDAGLSSVKRGRGEHRKRRGECIQEFHRILGRMPLRYSFGKVVNSVKEQGLCEKGGKLVPCDQQVS